MNNQIAYIERNGQLQPDEQKVVDYLILSSKASIVFISLKQLTRGKIIIGKNPYLVIGGLKFMKIVFKQMGITMPHSNTYPEVLRNFLCRDVREAVLGSVDSTISTDSFVKPRFEFKSFTGDTIQNLNIQKLKRKYNYDYPIWISENINIISEYRAYVVNGKILDIVEYWNSDTKVELSVSGVNTIQAAVGLLTKSNENLSAYAIDFAVKFDGSHGRVVLLELNEGFAIDSYTTSDEIYTKVIKTRWDELMKKRVIETKRDD